MRISPLHDLLAQKGATFEERYGIEITKTVSDFSTEYKNVRDSVGVTDFSYMQMFSIPEETGVDFLDDLFAGNVARVRFGRILHTFLADTDGNLVADCYIANNDEELVLLCESIVSDTELKEIFNKHGAVDAGLKDITAENVLISVDGYKSWSVVKDIFGTDVLGLPYLSVEMYPFENEEISLFRAGKTSEFGYALMAPIAIAEKLMETLLETAAKYDGGLCGVSIHNDLRLEGRFFNIYSEGVLVKDPLSLGLQWMIDFDKENYVGHDAILKRREFGLSQKIIGVTCVEKESFTPGTAIYNNGEQVASLQTVCYSPVLEKCVGLALFPVEIAYAGLTFNLATADGVDVETISMPPIMPKSLTVRLDEM